MSVWVHVCGGGVRVHVCFSAALANIVMVIA